MSSYTQMTQSLSKSAIDLQKEYRQSEVFVRIFELLRQGKTHKILLEGVNGSLLSFLASSLYQLTHKNILIILPYNEESSYVFNDLQQLVGKDDVYYFPPSHKNPYETEDTDNANILLRAETLSRISTSTKPGVVVASADAVFEKVITQKALSRHMIEVTAGLNLSVDFLNETLFEYGFERVDFVTEPGQFSIRGGIVDVFSFVNEHPYRLEFFGDEIESIRLFHIDTQLSFAHVQKALLLPNIENKHLEDKRLSLVEVMGSENTVILVPDDSQVVLRMNALMEKATQKFQSLNSPIRHIEPENLFISGDMFRRLLQREEQSVVSIGKTTCIAGAIHVIYESSPHPVFHKNFQILTDYLHKKTSAGYQVILTSGSSRQLERLHSALAEHGCTAKYITTLVSLHDGFEDHINQKILLTDHQIFERYHKFKIKNFYEQKQAITLKELTSLQYGDFVAHIDYGIGKFAGLQKIENDGKVQEAIKLIYKDNDVLYVSIHALHKISKYNGKEGTEPSLSKLGTNTWARKKESAKKKVKELAFDLIQLYAKRKASKGFAFSPDSYLQNELEASFMYEDTPDQVKATADVKNDMESAVPMDRLVCGDVGFGKTEVAIRAAFKAAIDGKQTAVMVPTTILAFQHYKTFSARLKDFPVKVEYLSRFKTPGQQREILEKLAKGDIDIIIGTNILVSDRVKFKDLGLLIIDEEQKFGVGVKEKLKTLRVNIDTLTLTATPIPRTLQFSLMAARDLSVMSSPPPNRQPVDTQIITWNEEVIRDVILEELRRDGQVYFIHNRIENIFEIAGMLQRLVPGASIAVAHGRMEGNKLEEILLGFMEGDYDILVSTSIAENGLDIPNANTIIINQAHNFGLSDLHQLRGRVGRSNKKAYCRLIAPPLSTLSEFSRKRLKAIEQFTDLGSGFQIAMKDLEIRGAGNLLGGEQSGFITDIGFETYQKILEEAIQELKENEFRDLYESELNQNPTPKDCSIETDIEVLFPDEYINKTEERFRLYQQLDQLQSEEEIEQFETELKDRFGPLPLPASELLDSIRLRLLARECGFEKITIKQEIFLGYFPQNSKHAFYHSDRFQQLLQNIARFKNIQLKEKNNRLFIRINHIPTIKSATDWVLKLARIHTMVDALQS
ncbi:MAG: transcription-repair coupling factor [Thermaurantimonas sp.]